MNTDMRETVEISAVVPVGERYDATGRLATEYVRALRTLGKRFELIFVLDGRRDEFLPKLKEMAAENDEVRVFQLSKYFGEATALTAGFEHATGEIMVTLPAYYQIEPAAVPDLIGQLQECDMAIAVRWPRAVASRFEAFRRVAFHRLVHFFAGEEFSDLGCSARAMKRKVVEEIPLYGEQDRFLPLLARRRGFDVREVKLSQAAEDRFEGRYGVRVYIRRALDIITVFFLTRFTKKPLRFFGTIGSITGLLGGVFLLFVVIERLFFGVTLGDRPALLLSSLLVVLGLQLFALGLLGELIIFTHGKHVKEYTIEKVVN